MLFVLCVRRRRIRGTDGAAVVQSVVGVCVCVVRYVKCATRTAAADGNAGAAGQAAIVATSAAATEEEAAVRIGRSLVAYSVG